MSRTDKRFALIRAGKPWYAVMIEDRDSGRVAFRVSGNGTRDAWKQAEQLTDLKDVARSVLQEGKRMRCAPENGKASSLYLTSSGVTGYELDDSIARVLGVAARGATA